MPTTLLRRAALVGAALSLVAAGSATGAHAETDTPPPPPPVAQTTTLKITTSPTVTYGATAVLTAKLTSSGKAMPGRTLKMCLTPTGAKTSCYSRTTDSAGVARLSFVPKNRTQTYVDFNGDNSYRWAMSMGPEQMVRPKVALTISKRVATIKIGPAGRHLIHLQRYNATDKRWESMWVNGKFEFYTPKTGTMVVTKLSAGKYRVWVGRTEATEAAFSSVVTAK